MQNQITILIEKPFLWLLFYLLLSDNNDTKYNNANKEGKWTLYNLDTIGNPIVSNYHSELTKYMFFKNYLEDKDSRTIAITPVPVEQFEFLNKKKKIKIKNRHLELNEISLDKKWTLSGKKMEYYFRRINFKFL